MDCLSRTTIGIDPALHGVAFSFPPVLRALVRLYSIATLPDMKARVDRPGRSSRTTTVIGRASRPAFVRADAQLWALTETAPPVERTADLPGWAACLGRRSGLNLPCAVLFRGTRVGAPV